jgi:hypothetical protein
LNDPTVPYNIIIISIIISRSISIVKGSVKFSSP